MNLCFGLGQGWVWAVFQKAGLGVVSDWVELVRVGLGLGLD
jgi:hypothetical protein